MAGRVALVTGASRGIGAATARRLASDGASLVLVARSLQPLEALAEEIAPEALVVAVDLSQPEAIDVCVARLHERYGKVDILVNNAGALPPAARLERITREQWEATLALSLSAPWYLSTQLKPLMQAGSVVVNVASTAAFYPSVGLGAYNVAKAGLAMLTRCCALEWAGAGIRVVGVAPGKVDTALVQPILEYSAGASRALNPLGKLAQPEEVAALIGYLVSDEAAYITGAIYPIDGGELTAVATPG